MTNAEARFNQSLRPRKPESSLGRTAQDVHLDSHTAFRMYLWWTLHTMPDESYRGRCRLLLSCSCEVFRLLINSLCLLNRDIRSYDTAKRHVIVLPSRGVTSGDTAEIAVATKVRHLR